MGGVPPVLPALWHAHAVHVHVHRAPTETLQESQLRQTKLVSLPS